MISPNLEFNYLSDQKNFNLFKEDENFNYCFANLDKEKNFNIMDKPKYERRGNLTLNPTFYNDLNKISSSDHESQNGLQFELLKNECPAKSFRSSWPSYECVKQPKPDKFRRLSLNLSSEYPRPKLINFDTCKNFKHNTRTVKRQNSAPERLRKPFDDTILEEDEQQLQIDQSTNEKSDQSNNLDQQMKTNQPEQLDQPDQPAQTKLNQMRYRRRQMRYRTQPITFDEIKEVDESQLIDQDNSINKLLNFHISDACK